MSTQQINSGLSEEQKQVLFHGGTEAPFSGSLLKNRKAGEYTCANCGAVVFRSDAKFESTTPGLAGWPSFSDVASSSAVSLQDDDSMGMHRTEVVCKKCGSHIGHYFDDPAAPNHRHYCINSCALGFEQKNKHELH